ncbi:hypothetical protein RDWZM_001842 [Blomia tropicalis]|uniref:Regulator of microtubule dynamics protein 1 n=1 Tax=Blomia tropicalis TaxID=40697 RepID=A0A9Q0MCX1_BLOTA|nr:Regulator of Microtubule Dynamic [Blomia tropicalis]KAJ6223297.1 hypothetical protein RDWZM_001842 [Blomia tropicalis]
MVDKKLEKFDKDADNVKSNKQATYEELKIMLQNSPNDVEIAWRLARVCIQLTCSYLKDNDKDSAKSYAEQAYEYAKQSVELDSKKFESHRWFCAASGRLSFFVGTKDRIRLGYEFQTHYKKAVKINANDDLLHHMYGQWCYEVASLSFVERKLASTFYSDPPTSSYDEALQSLKKADQLRHQWKANQMWMAKTYIAMGNKDDAIACIQEGMSFPITNEDEQLAHKELNELYNKYC